MGVLGQIMVNEAINYAFRLFLRLSGKGRSWQTARAIQPPNNAAGRDTETIEMLRSLFHEPLYTVITHWLISEELPSKNCRR